MKKYINIIMIRFRTRGGFYKKKAFLLEEAHINLAQVRIIPMSY